jgi:hypothetical protein
MLIISPRRDTVAAKDICKDHSYGKNRASSRRTGNFRPAPTDRQAQLSILRARRSSDQRRRLKDEYVSILR